MSPDTNELPIDGDGSPRPDVAQSVSDGVSDEASLSARLAFVLFAVGLAAAFAMVAVFLQSERSALKRADVERVGLLTETSAESLATRVVDLGGALDERVVVALRGEVARIADARGVLQVALHLDGGREVIHAQSAEAAQAAGGKGQPALQASGPGRTLLADHLIVAREFRLLPGSDEDALLVIRAGYAGLETRMRDLVSLAGRSLGICALLLLFLTPIIARWMTRRYSRAVQSLRDGDVPSAEHARGGGAELVELVERIEDDAERVALAEAERVTAVRDARAEVEGMQASLENLRSVVGEAQESSRAAAAAKAAFVANTSHEVRTPLHAVLGSTSLLLDTALDAEQRALAERAGRAADLLLELVDEVLDLARFDAGQIELEVRAFDPGALVEEVTELVGAAAAAKGLSIGSFVSPECPHSLMGDRRRIRQALIRLADNAIKFTDSGEVILELAWEAAQDGIPRARFTVADTGPGIGIEEQGRMFGAFEQLDSSDTRRHGGVGVGLALVARIAKAAGGEVELDSQPGRGARFGLVLPLALEGKERVGIAERVTQRRVPLQGLSVLLMDDAPATARCFARTLEVLGAQVRVESSTYAGFEAWVRSSYDLVMLDARLAGRDAFLGAIESNDTRGSVPVILMTPPMSGRAPREPMDETVTAIAAKPMSRSDIERVVQHALEPEEQSTRASANRLEPAESLVDSDLRERIRILLVEDNPTNQQLVQYVLGKRGYRIDVASNGRRAVDAFAVGDYDVILMDCQMPEMDGYEATLRIRELEEPRGTRTPILAMSASASADDRRKCLDSGMDDLLAKPFEPAEMIKWLEGWLLRTALDGNQHRRPRVTRAEAMAGLEVSRTAQSVDSARVVAEEANKLAAPLGELTRVEALAPALPEEPVAQAEEYEPVARPDGLAELDLAGVLDDSVLGPLLEDKEGRELAEELVMSFLELAPGRLAELERALAVDDFETCARTAHSMVSTSGTVGAMRLARMLRELQNIARAGRKDEFARLFAESQREFELASIALRRSHG